MYIGAITLADLTNPNGKTLNNAKLHGHISRLGNVTRWLKIRQDRPSEPQWRIWRKANLLWSTKKGRCHQPLGKWLRTNDERRIMCATYANGNQVVIRMNDEFQTYKIDESGRQIGDTHMATLRYEDLHPEATPADVYEASGGQWTLRSDSSVLSARANPDIYHVL